MKSYYTYFYLRYDGTPYYVGKGHGNRAYDIAGHSIKPPKDLSRIIIQGYQSENDALEAEKIFVAYYGRIDLGTGCLRNRTDGGEGGSPFKGRSHSTDTKERMRLSAIERKIMPPPISSENRRLYALGNRSRTGIKHTEQRKLEIGNFHRGRKRSEETKNKMSVAAMGNKSRLGKPHLEGTKAKIAESNRGKRRSHETCLRMRAASIKKITDVQVLEIRSRAAYESTYALAREFGVSQPLISGIVNGRKRVGSSI